MTQPPDWALAVPSTPGVHPSGTESTAFTRPFTQAQLLEIGAQFLEQFLTVVVKAVVGAFIPGGGNGAAFTQLQSWASNIPGLNAIVDMIFKAITGSTSSGTDPIADLTDALTHIPFLNILGIGGPGNIGASVQSTWDQLIGGLVGAVGSGAGLSDLFNIGQDVSSRATLGQMGWDVLGIRNNKSLNTGFLPTSESNFGLDKVALAGTAPTFALTQSTAPMAFVRISESASKGVVSWLGSGVTSITSAFVNIYKMDTGTGGLSLVHASSNIIGNLSGTMQHNVYSLPTPLQVAPGEVYGIEVAVQGAGTHSIVGSATWLPDHPNVFPRRMSAVRNSGTSAAPSTLTPSYSSNVPFVEFGVSAGNVDAPHAPQTVLFSTAGTSSIPVPFWANIVEVIEIPGAGGGRLGGSWGISGKGGSAGSWNAITWTRGTDFDSASTPSLSITVGAGGVGGTISSQNGANGGNTAVTLPSTTGHSSATLTVTGGAGGNSLQVGGALKDGASPGDYTYGGVIYKGGVVQSTFGADGAAPGGGGAGGNWISVQPGGKGAPGAVWVRFKQVVNSPGGGGSVLPYTLPFTLSAS